MQKQPNDYYSGLNKKLLDAIPTTSKRVIELGCANGRLGQRFKDLNPSTHWHGIEINPHAANQARKHLDKVTVANLDQIDTKELGKNYDTVVIGDLLEHLSNPEKTLETLYDITSKDAILVCCVPNMSHFSVIQRLIGGDIAYDSAGLLDKTHTKFFSPSSLFRTLLDASWLPDLTDQYTTQHENTDFQNALLHASRALGIPDATAIRNFKCYQMVVKCKKWDMSHVAQPGPRASFSIIAPINRPWQAELNILRSPGLEEVGAEILCVTAQNAAEAYEKGCRQAKHPWRILVHQDVYFPPGSGYGISQHLGTLDALGAHHGPVGFAGLETSTKEGTSRYAGLVIDRTTLFDHQPSNHAASIDEFAVAMHENSHLKIDPNLGWHLWATDLCIQAERSAKTQPARIVNVPLFHNSVTDHQLPEAFYRSAKTLLDKYPDMPEIATLCGCLRRQA